MFHHKSCWWMSTRSCATARHTGKTIERTNASTLTLYFYMDTSLIFEPMLSISSILLNPTSYFLDWVFDRKHGKGQLLFKIQKHQFSQLELLLKLLFWGHYRRSALDPMETILPFVQVGWLWYGPKSLGHTTKHSTLDKLLLIYVLTWSLAVFK